MVPHLMMASQNSSLNYLKSSESTHKYLFTVLPCRSPLGFTNGWNQISRFSYLCTHPRVLFSNEHLPTTHKSNTSNSTDMKKGQEQRFKHTFLEWQAEDLVLYCSEFVTSGLCSGEQSHKVTVMHLNGAEGRKYNFNCKTCQKSNL